MSTPTDGEKSTLEEARSRLYKPGAFAQDDHLGLRAQDSSTLPHTWDGPAVAATPAAKPKHSRLAGLFFVFAGIFFTISLLVAGYFFYFGGNTVSSNKIALTVDGPTTIAGGDTVPLLLTITNKNPVPLENAVVEIVFPDSARNADNTLEAYPRYIEDLGRIESGATITRSVRAVLFGGAGETLSLPLSLSYTTSGSNASFTKKGSYTLGVASTPLELSVGTLAETVAGRPLTFTVTVRSNATLPVENVVVESVFPFGFSVTSSSVPMTGSSFLLGTLSPGASKTITLTGMLAGQDSEQRVFHYKVGTARTAGDTALAVTYMNQSATVSIAAPFITTGLSINGDTTASPILAAGSVQNVTVSYSNTLPTNAANVTVEVALSGSGIDYNSIRSPKGFYRSSDHTIVFSRDTDPSLASLSPGATGLGTFSFRTLAGGAAPTATFSVSVAGTRVGQTNVPERVQSSLTRTAKIVTTARLASASLHSSGPFQNTGPIPPRPNQTTTYTISWGIQNTSSAIADGVVSAILPSYVSYTEQASGPGSFVYDSASRTITWRVGEVPQGASLLGSFQVALTPSTSQLQEAPQLTGTVSFTGFDRFASAPVRLSAAPVTTETVSDPGYSPVYGTVQ